MFARAFNSYREAFAGLPAASWMLAGVLLVGRSGTMVLPFLAMYLQAQRGLSVSAAGQLLAVYSVSGILGTYLGGMLSSRIGAIRVVWLSLMAAVPGFVLMPWCPNIAWLSVVLAYQGIVLEAGRPANTTAVTLLTTPDMYPRALALNRVALNLGMTIGPSIGGVLAMIDYSLLFYANALSAAAAAVVCGLFFRPWSTPAPTATSSEAQAPTVHPLRDGVFVRYMLLQFVAGIVFFQLMSTVPLSWRDRYGQVEWGIGALFAVNTLVIVAVEMILLRSMGRFRPMRVIALGNGLVCLGFGLMAFGSSATYAVFTVLVWTLGEMLAAPYAASFVAQRSSPRDRGLYMGYFAMTFAASNVVAPVIGTWLYDWHHDAPWWCCLVCAVVLPLGFLRLERRTAAQPVAPLAVIPPLVVPELASVGS